MNNDTIQEKMELIAAMIEAEEKNLQMLKLAFNELMLLQKGAYSTNTLIDCSKYNEEIIFEKVLLLYQRYRYLRLEAKKHKIPMNHLGALSTFSVMYSLDLKCRNRMDLSPLKYYWFHGRGTGKPEKNEAFEKLPSFQELLNTPNELITTKMLDVIILEDLLKHNASRYKGFDEFIAPMEY